MDENSLCLHKDAHRTNKETKSKYQKNGSDRVGISTVMEPRSKHIDIRYHGIRESIMNGKIELFFIDGAENPTDLLTKNLLHEKFAKFKVQLGLQFPSGSS